MDRAALSATALDRARRWLLLASVLLLALLTVSGLLLLAVYRPGSTLADLHRLAGRALLVTAALSLPLHLFPRPRPLLAASTAGLVAAVVAALGSGPLVAWRALAVWAVAVQEGRTSFSGYRWLLGDDIRSVLVDRTELEPFTVSLLLGAHLAAAALTAGIVATVALLQRPGRPEDPEAPGQPPPTRSGTESPGGGA
jgi:hypothetical protein